MNGVTAVELDTAALESLARGKLIRPGDEAYDQARAVHNAMIDRRPALIVRCVDVADVIAVVNFARDNQVPLAVRGGAHGVPGHGTVDGGIVLDLSPMKGIVVDPQARVVTAQGGCTWGDVDHATHPFGLAVPGGIVSTTGVGGLTLGGGHGYLTRAYGLTIDNLLSADVVTADGSYVTASEDHAEDLFWALRGGGGNFGVVTSFTFRLQPASIHVAGPMLWHLDQAAEAMQMYRRVLSEAPDELTAFFVFLVVPPGPPFPEELHMKNMCGVVWCHLGTPEDAVELLAAAREFGPPVFDHVGAIPHPVLQSLFDELAAPGLQNYWRGDFFTELSDEAIAAHVEHGATVPNIFSGLHLYPIDGAAGRVGSDETPWSYREARWSQVIFAADPEPAAAEDMRSWVVETWDATHPFSAGGAYVNFLPADEGQERVRASYRDNYDRLAQVKKRYDPTNLFRINQNIRPAD
jgi:FAD/FMN-containing dehydrogenase